MDAQGASATAIQVNSRSPKTMLGGHQQPILVEVHRLGFYVELTLLVWRAEWSPVFQFVAELGEGGASRR